MTDPLALIRSFEGFRETPYWDVNALRTGYGSDTVTLPDGTVQRVTDTTRVTREDADRDLARRVNTEFLPRAASAVGPEVFASLSGPQQAALASITYNYGELPSTVAQAARSGDPATTAEAIRALGSHNDGINRDRRNQEADIFAGAAGLPSGAAQSGQASDASNPYARLAYAYANGKMTPEDEAIYERGMAEGVMPKAEKSKPKELPNPLAIYAQTAMRQPEQSQIQPLQVAAVQNATPLQRFPGI